MLWYLSTSYSIRQALEMGTPQALDSNSPSGIYYLLRLGNWLKLIVQFLMCQMNVVTVSSGGLPFEESTFPIIPSKSGIQPRFHGEEPEAESLDPRGCTYSLWLLATESHLVWKLEQKVDRIQRQTSHHTIWLSGPS